MKRRARSTVAIVVASVAVIAGETACAPAANGGPMPTLRVDGGPPRDDPRDGGNVDDEDDDDSGNGNGNDDAGGGAGTTPSDGGTSVRTEPLGLRTGCDEDDDPLSQTGWAGFCGDRRDDNCAMDVVLDACPTASFSSPTPCNSADEACPQTQPASAAPDWDCTGEAPANVVAVARFTDANEQVAAFCAFVYESTAVAGELYVAVDLESGANPFGPDQKCSSDFGARRHLYFSNLDDGACAGLRFTYPDQVDDQILSNACRKMIRNVAQNDTDFEPDIQYFASSRAEADAKLAVLDTAEIACVGIDNSAGEPYRPTEVWVVQAAAPITLTGN